jgi:hypothetical protein
MMEGTMDGSMQMDGQPAGPKQLGDPMTINVHIRLGADGEVRAMTDWETDDGCEMDDNWSGDTPYRDFVIAVTARPPLALDDDAAVEPAATVAVPDTAGLLVSAVGGADDGDISAAPA